MCHKTREFFFGFENRFRIGLNIVKLKFAKSEPKILSVKIGRGSFLHLSSQFWVQLVYSVIMNWPFPSNSGNNNWKKSPWVKFRLYVEAEGEWSNLGHLIMVSKRNEIRTYVGEFTFPISGLAFNFPRKIGRLTDECSKIPLKD